MIRTIKINGVSYHFRNKREIKRFWQIHEGAA